MKNLKLFLFLNIVLFKFQICCIFEAKNINIFEIDQFPNKFKQFQRIVKELNIVQQTSAEIKNNISNATDNTNPVHNLINLLKKFLITKNNYKKLQNFNPKDLKNILFKILMKQLLKTIVSKIQKIA